MPSTNFARIERAGLADFLEKVGPDQPTLCEGWRTRDLAAHVVVRDRRPDSAPGTMVKALAGHTDRLRNKAAAQPWGTLLQQLRNPPRFSMAGIEPLDRLLNTTELFVHYEDARRAQPDWSPRPLDEQLARKLTGQIKLSAKLALRTFPARITIQLPRKQLVVGAGGEAVEVTGDAGELTLFLMGRQLASKASVTGPDAIVEKLRTTKLGI